MKLLEFLGVFKLFKFLTAGSTQERDVEARDDIEAPAGSSGIALTNLATDQTPVTGAPPRQGQSEMPSQSSTQQGTASLPQSSTGHTRDVVFQNGPLGVGLKEAEFGSAIVQVVVDGGQAARGGVKVNDLVAAVDTETMTYAEVMAEMTNKQRPFTMSFFRPPPSSGSAKSVQL